MSKRPIHSKELGEFFRGLREAKRWGQSQAVGIAERKGLNALTRQVLLRLESGQTKNPEPEVLAAIATLYGLPKSEVLTRFVNQRYGILVDPSSHGRTGQSDSHQPGESDDPASDRVAELERRIAEYQRILATVENASSVLARALAAGEKVSKAAGAEPKARKHHRRAS